MFPNSSNTSKLSLPSSSSSFPVPALYHEPTFRDFGVRWFGQRGFGGILMDWNPDGSHRWIPQYNLKNYWKQAIPPLPVGLIEPLVPPRFRSTNDFDRLPGEFSYKTEDSQLYNRNLLAARYYDANDENSAQLKIWTVNERSKRHFLECYSVNINHKGYPIIESQLLLSNRKMKMVPPVKFYPEVEHLPRESILEIRTSVWSDSEHTKLYLRSPTLLRMLRQDEADPSIKHDLVPIFNKAVKYFAESDLLDDQLAVVDHGGRVWMHDVTSQTPQEARKVNTNEYEVYQRVAFCDNPRMLAIAANWHVETVDARCSGGSGACARLWGSPSFGSRRPGEPGYLQATPPPPAIIYHLERVPGTANMYVIMTDYALHLLDDRFPGKTVVHVRHPFFTGAHKMIVSQGVKDPGGGGMVFSIYCLDQMHYANMGVFMMKLYLHPSGVWSAVDSFHSLGEPHDFNSATRCGKYADGEEIPREPTRAISLIEGVSGRRSDDTRTILLRQQDDGAIWWQWMSHEAVSENRKARHETESAERIRETRNGDERWKRNVWSPVYTEGIDELFKESPHKSRVKHRLEVTGFSSSIIKEFSSKSVRLMRKTNEIKLNKPSILDKLEVLSLDDEKSVLSKIVMDTFKEAAEKLQSAPEAS